MKRRAVLFAGAAVAASATAVAMKPRRRASKDFAPIQLEQQVPASFGPWTIDKSLVPVLPDPSLQAALDQIYGQVLARTYINRANSQRVMLSIAYGEDQGTDATAAHRPEFCYTAQGFSVASMGTAVLGLGGRNLTVRRLVGQLQSRREPITYWVTLNDRAVLPGFSRKVEQIMLGLRGQIPDGMLIRVSSLTPDPAVAFSLQEVFLNDLLAALPPELQSRYFGAKAA
jgi:EpsI family protein